MDIVKIICDIILILIMLILMAWYVVLNYVYAADFFFEDSIRSVAVIYYYRKEKVRCLLFHTKGIKKTEYVSFLPKTPHASLARDMLRLNKIRLTKDKTIWDKKTNKLAIMLGLYEIKSMGYAKKYDDDRQPYKDYAMGRLGYKENTTGNKTKVSFDQDSAYAALGLKPNADISEIHVRYRDLVKVFHPDRSPDTDDEAMKRINLAYATLKEELA